MLYNIDVRKIGHLNIKTMLVDIEARVLIGWYLLASQSERVPTRCFMLRWPTFRTASIVYTHVQTARLAVELL